MNSARVSPGDLWSWRRLRAALVGMGRWSARVVATTFLDPRKRVIEYPHEQGPHLTLVAVPTTSGTGTVTTPTITLQPFFSGIALDVTPQIDDDGNIILHIHPAVTVVEERSKQVNLGTLGSFTLPLASSSINETDSIVRVQDGHIVAIGGLMSQEQSNSRDGLPGVSRVPGLGLLFGQKGSAQRKRELVILIKSTVIQNENSWRQDVAETQERIQALDPRKTEWTTR